MQVDADGSEERRKELGSFLRKRRAELVRADHDLPPVGRNRTLGLRREEIAYQSGLSVTWYTWLEQGRDINPSRQVLDSVARNMRLTAAEHAYVLGLADYAPPRSDPAGAGPTVAPEHVRQLLDAFDPAPAFAITAGWDVSAWNRSYQNLFPRIAEVPVAERNLLRLVFVEPAVRTLLPDWEATSRHFLAEYRAEAGQSLGQEPHVSLVGELLATSEDFRAAWEEHRIERFASRERSFVTGKRMTTYAEHRLVPADVPDLHLVVYLPVR